MKVIKILFFLSLCSVNNVFSIELDTSITVFNSSHIQFGDSINKQDYKVFDKGRIISNSIKIPNLNGTTRILANLRIKSLGDKWDRFGSVYLKSGNKKIELIKFMTGFGVGNKSVPLTGGVVAWDDEMIFNVDISYLFPLFKDSVNICAFIDTWVMPGWELSFSLTFRSDIYALNSKNIYPLVNTTGDFINYKVFNNGGITDTIDILKTDSKYLLYYYSSGHGGDSAGDEFNMKENIISVNNSSFNLIPWRDDCRRFRSLNPTSAKWEGDLWSSDLSRSGWCPGDLSLPYVFNITQNLSSGKNIFNFNILNSDTTTEVLDYWNISAFIVEY